MNAQPIKKACLFAVIGFLGLSALIAVVALLTGDFSDTQIRIILTTLTIAGASICGMACFAFIEKRGLLKIGAIGVLCAVIAAGLAIIGIWSEIGGGTYWKYTITFIIASVAFAHCFLLNIPTLQRSYRWCQYLLVLFVVLLAAQVDFAVWDETSGSVFYRIMGVLAVIVVLLTLIVPILSRFTSGGAAAPTLALTAEAGEIYRDASGQRYRVSKI